MVDEDGDFAMDGAADESREELLWHGLALNATTPVQTDLDFHVTASR